MLVEWHDAWADLDELSAESALKDHRPGIIHTAGYLLQQDDAGVMVCAEQTCGPQGPVQYRGRTFIPAGMVVKVRKLK